MLSNHSISGTQHPRIRMSQEPAPEIEAFNSEFGNLKTATALRNVPLALASLERIVEGYYASRAFHSGLEAHEEYVLH